MKILTIIFLLGLLTGCRPADIDTGRPCSEVENAIRRYYVAKYPAFAELVALQTNRNVGLGMVRAGELHKVSPVREIVNSYPHGPYLTFVEYTELSPTTLSVVTLNLSANKDGSCRISVSSGKGPKEEGAPFAVTNSITTDDVWEILIQIPATPPTLRR